ncbi:MAG: hypothetical protein CSYNP_01625 [Syntrophus sp. SKADARSKE-3]|nr:hypothetical protein [Syntrophus sp. SKADARSKE-3]
MEREIILMLFNRYRNQDFDQDILIGIIITDINAATMVKALGSDLDATGKGVGKFIDLLLMLGIHYSNLPDPYH